jgi:hypothetical protein
MKICPLALMSGHTCYCNSSCAFSSNGECLVATALKGYINETHSSASSQYLEPVFQPPREGKSPW